MDRSSLPIRWDEILERARRDSLPLAAMTVRLYDDGNFHHGSQFCGHNTRPVDLSAIAAVATVVPVWCECGGWTGTRFGGLLHAVREQYLAIEDETSELRHTDWSDAWHAFKGLGGYPSWAYRTEDVDLENLRQRTKLATLSVLEKSRTTLPLPDLEKRIVAQGIRIPVLPTEGAHLQRWANDLRVDTAQTTRPDRRARERCAYDDFLDATLERARVEDDRVLVVVLGGPVPELPLDTGLPAELALLLWALGHPSGVTHCLHLLRPVGEGLDALAANHRRIAVAAGDERDPEILEAVRTLCEDANATRGQPTGIDLDGILATARML